MKVSITHENVRVEYEDDRTMTPNQPFVSSHEEEENVSAIIRVITSLGEVVAVLKEELNEKA